MAGDGFVGVIRAGGMKLAGTSEKRREERDVAAHDQEQDPRGRGLRVRAYSAGFTGAAWGKGARGNSFSSSAVSREKFAVAAELRG